MGNVRRCAECGGLIMRINPRPWVISLDRVWVHVNWRGKIKRRIQHKPVL